MKSYFLFQLALTGTASAFSAQPRLQSSRPPSILQSDTFRSHGEMETFERAVDCAEKFGVCDLDQMEELAKELEAINWSYFETTAVDKSLKEIWDRKDVAEVLQLQIEYRLRMDYLNDANLFVQDVHDMEDAYAENE